MTPPRVSVEERKGAPVFEGRLSAISLFDICQFLMLNRKTGILTARSGSHSAYLTFHEGQLMNAADETLREGESVILSTVQWAQGTFSFEAGPVSPDRRIHSSTENILLEAARQLDEIRAGEALEDTGRSHVEALQEGREWTARLGEAFRHAVNDEGRAEARDWKERVLSYLTSEAGRRVILGPGQSVVLHGRDGTTTLVAPTAEEVEAWAAELHPSSSEREPGSMGSPPRKSRTASLENGACIWSNRLVSPHGAQLILGRVRTKVPTWSNLGLGDDLARALAATSGTLVLAAIDQELLAAAAAAWVNRRATAGECGWVIESWPEHDWRAANGLVMTATPEEVESQGGLAKLVELVDARFCVLREPIRDVLLRDALSLSLSTTRCRVLVTVRANVASAALRSVEQRLQSDGRPELPWMESLAGVWLIERPAPRAPVQSRLVVPNEAAAA